MRVLCQEHEFRYEADGRRTLRSRTIYRIDSEQADHSWSVVSASWAPWNQERPELKARVVASDGQEHWLDPATIAESGIGEDGDAVYSDRRELRAPLPAFAAGAIVEEQTLVRDTTPSFGAGAVSRVYFGGSAPVLRSRLAIDAPAALPVRWLTRLLPGISPRREESDGRVRLVFEGENLEPPSTVEPNLPPDVPRWPYVAFSTGASWSSVARDYDAIVDRQLANADLLPFAREAAGKASDRRTIASNLVARLHKEIRYTGVEFGEATIVPRTPREVLARKYGDCKDKAAMLVGMLRSLGIPASVALLSSGYNEDVWEELPGLGEFDHAIVHVPGDPELWIDATADRARVGELPLSDQGRLALIADAETTQLVRIPEGAAAENGSVKTRTFRLSEMGAAAIEETTEYYGAYDRHHRSRYDEGDALRERLEKYVKDAYLADSVKHFEQGDPADLTRPFKLSLTVAEGWRGNTDENEAVVALTPARLTDDLPNEILSEGKERRKQAFFFVTPFFLELRYRIVPPPGYVLRDMPPSEDLALGTARLTTKWVGETEGVVAGSLRFESGKRLISAEEFESTRQAVAKLRQTGVAFVRFDQAGEKALGEGRVAEALAEFRRLASLHPKEALHHTQIALALLRAGCGDAAREEARRAVGIEPTSMIAQRRLGWVLQHDAVGRRFGHGFDLMGAVEAHRKAVELDPKNIHARLNLAFLLEYNASGERWGEGAPLNEAAEEYWRLSREYAEHHVNLAHVLFRGGRYAELREAAHGYEEATTRDPFEVLAAALIEGAPAALTRAAQIANVEKRREALTDSADNLVRARRYPEAAAVLREAAKGANNAAALLARAELLTRATKHEDLPDLEPGPAGVVHTFLRGLLLDWDAGRLGSLFVKRLGGSLTQADTKMFEPARVALDRGRRQLELSTDAYADVVLSGVRLGVEGDDRLGYRVRMDGAPEAATHILYVVREGEGYRIMGSLLVDLGTEALVRADAGDLPGARKVLDWARERVGGDDGDAVGGHPMVAFWTVGTVGTEDEVRLAAAALLVNDRETAVRGLEILDALRPGAEVETDAGRLRFDRARLWALSSLGRRADILALAERLALRHPTSGIVFGYRVRALAGLKRWTDLKSLALERLGTSADDLRATRALRTALNGQGDFAGIGKLCVGLLPSGRGNANDYNECAWSTLFEDAPRETGLEWARRSVELSKRQEAAFLHTLASLYADTDHPGEAHDVILEALQVSGDEDPSPADWFVFGRIAESYGVTDAALAAYARLGSSAESTDSTWHLAQKRMKAIRARAADGKTVRGRKPSNAR